MRSAWVVGILAALAVTASADPARPRVFQDDHRLDKVISVHWKKETLYDALHEIGRQTGVHLDPDRSLVDEPLLGSMSNRPAHEILEQVATLFHFTWVRNGGKPEAPNYLLYQDRAARQEEQDEIDGGRRQVLEAIQKELQKYRRLGQLPPERLQQEIDRADDELSRALTGGLAGLGNNPALARKMQDGQAARSISSPIGRSMLDLLDRLTPAEWQAVSAEQPLVFSTSPGEDELRLDARTADQLRSAVPSLPVPRSIFKALGPEVAGAIDKAEEGMRTGWSHAQGFKVTVHMNLNLGAQPVGLLRVGPEPLGSEDSNPLMGMTGLMLVGAPQLLDEPMEDPAEREKRLAADPVLGKTAELQLPEKKPQGKSLPGLSALLGAGLRTAEAVPAVEKAYGLPILADAYNREALAIFVPPGKGAHPLYKVLDSLCGITRTWEVDGDVIRLRSKTWAHDRRSEVPVRYMRKWLDVRARKGTLGINEQAEIATSLRDEQMESLLFAALELEVSDFTDFALIPANKGALRFWGKLLPAQRMRLVSGAEIPVQTLFPFQKATLQAINQGQNQSAMSIAFGAKPVRSMEKLNRGVVSLQFTPAGQPAGAEVARPPASSDQPGLFTLKITYPGGQKDQFQILISKPTPAEVTGAAAPDAPQPAPSAK